ncbi:MAG: hypothetical protein GY726_02130 [Proteobacteria bacterium]|nr:hypothetical protein [Pseudomonadota bacterium]
MTSRSGLLSIAELMNSLERADRIDACFPQPDSNRRFKPSVFMETPILMRPKSLMARLMQSLN